MTINVSDTPQTVQRVKVGMTGLAFVLLLIVLASAIFRSASKEKPVDVVGGPKAAVVANLSITNDSAAADTAAASEPLAELGVAPSTADANSTAAPNQTATAPPATVPPAQPAPAQH